MKMVHRYVLISAGAGLITVPIIDVSALAGVHVALIKGALRILRTRVLGARRAEHPDRHRREPRARLDRLVGGTEGASTCTRSS